LSSRLYRVILDGVKTAISIPDETFAEVERRAKELGLNRSQFFTRAVQRYLADLESESITAQINAAIDAQTGPDEATADFIAYGRRRLAAMDDDW
jgi:metal-responsive CopG/Arc/MetJ family transcriptional regulator